MKRLLKAKADVNAGFEAESRPRHLRVSGITDRFRNVDQVSILAKTQAQAMPRPKVWGDFTVNDAFEGTDDAGDDLVEFTCPYNCGKPERTKGR